MLSRVLTGARARSAEPMVFEPAVPQSGPPGLERRSPATSEEANKLRERVRKLEADGASTQRDAFEAGRKQGEEQAQAAVGPVLQKLAATVSELTSLRAEARERAERDVVELALLVARRVLHRELAVDKGALTALVRVILERMARSERYSVTIHPDFAAAIQSAIPAAQLSRIDFVSDATCAPGTLIFRSDDGVIDASLDAQLEEIGRGLTDRIS